MYLRTVTAKGVEYLQLAHSYRDPDTGVPKVKVLHSFGRADRVDAEGLRRLVEGILRFLGPDEAEKIGLESPFEFLGSKDLGGPWLLNGLWERLKIGDALRKLLEKEGYCIPVERLIFSMVANRALCPLSKLAMERWVAQEALIPGLSSVEVHQLYRAMDFLLSASAELERRVFEAVAATLNLGVDLIFFDTTSTYFEIEGEDEDGLRRFGYSRDGRPDLAQAVVGFAVTRDGIPVRAWVWPGNTVDQNVVSEVKRDLNRWKISRVMLVMDAGFNSPENRRALQGAGDHYILGEKLRLGPEGSHPDALRRAGKYRKLPSGLEVKEVVVGNESPARRRFFVVSNPDEAKRDKEKREDIVSEVKRRLEELRQLKGMPHTKAACQLRSHPVYGRYIRQSKTGKLFLDSSRIRKEEKLDGKFLITTSDDFIPAEEVVSGYKGLWRIERLNRDLKHVVDVRPVYHRLEDRIRSHVLLCWLALVLIRVAENETGRPWGQIKAELSTLKVGMHLTKAGEIWQRNPLTKPQEQIFSDLKVKPPPRYLNDLRPEAR